MKKNYIEKFVMAILTFLLFSSFAHAQNNTDEIDNEKRNDIIQLLIVSGTADFAFAVIDDVIHTYKQYFTQVAPEYWENFKSSTNVKPFLDSIIGIYYSRFDHDEIKDLLKFFDSPVGRKWTLELTNMNEEVMTQANIFGLQVFNSLNQKLIDDGYINTGEAPDED